MTTQTEMLPDWQDQRVQAVYCILCSEDTPPAEEHWEGFTARRIVAALSQPERPAPQGWKLVPVEPTIAMCMAGDAARLSTDDATRSAPAYRAMLAASPTPPQAEPSATECDCRTEFQANGGKKTTCGSDQMRRAVADGSAFNLVLPQAEQAEAAKPGTERAGLVEEARDKIMALSLERSDNHIGHPEHEGAVERTLKNLAAALLSADSKDAGEPVAYMGKEVLEWLTDKERGANALTSAWLHKSAGGDFVVPIFARPQAADAQPLAKLTGDQVFEIWKRTETDNRFVFADEIMEAMIAASGITGKDNAS